MEDLRQFIAKVKEIDELRVVEGADWDLEIGAVTRLAAKAANPHALLFDRHKRLSCRLPNSCESLLG